MVKTQPSRVRWRSRCWRSCARDSPVLGSIITGYYLWKRDLLAAMFAHFLVDFVPNVLLPALGGDN